VLGLGLEERVEPAPVELEQRRRRDPERQADAR
jgi:hypothetical protein